MIPRRHVKTTIQGQENKARKTVAVRRRVLARDCSRIMRFLHHPAGKRR